VLVSSVAGRRGFPHASVYCATKFALAGLAESWRVELAPSGVRVILVCPGRTDTDFFVNAGSPAEHGPGGRATMARPEHVARRILRDAARGAREDVVSRGGRLIVWLNAVAPSLCDRLVARLPP
jgi:short-subunit dehydrogenase